MTLRDIILLASKVVALILWLICVLWLLGDVGGLMAVMFGRTPEFGAGDLIIQSYCQIGASILQVVSVIIMWLRSPQIAKHLAPESTFNQHLAIDEKWMSPIIGIVGIILIVIGMRGIATAASIIYGFAPQPPELIGHLITSVTQIILGVVMYFKSSRISEILQSKWKIENKKEAVRG